MAEFASKGVAGTGLGLGIAGTALGLLALGNNNGGGLFGGLFGGNNCNNNAILDTLYMSPIEAAQAAKESEDVLALTRADYEGRIATMTEMNAQYRDLNDKICKQGEKIGALEAGQYYQNIITHKDMELAEARSEAALYKATCKKVDGEVRIPYNQVSYPPIPSFAQPINVLPYCGLGLGPVVQNTACCQNQ